MPGIASGSPSPPVESLGALNAWLEQHCLELWGQTSHGSEPGTIADVWASEVESLMPLGRLFDGFVEQTKWVSPSCLVPLERNRYSVPASCANRPVSLRVYPHRLLVVAEGQVVCAHHRIINRSHQAPGQTIYDWRHYLAVIQRKPGALRNGASCAELPDACKRLQQHLLRIPGGDREMVEVLALVLPHDEEAVLVAIELALENGAPTKTHITNLLYRRLDGKPMTPPVVKAPVALALANEPRADVSRYDALRQDGEKRHAS